ncbi:MAG: class I SAM-dependent methyltransferase [Pirellulales bacterium]|nr:class I SAM-dependent methyltransferase [Pirellulales bacterium]
MPLDPAQLAAQQQFDRQSANYGSRHILADTTDVASLLAHLPPVLDRQPNRRALDIAAGAGHTGLFLAEQGWRVTLADLAPGMLEQCRQAAAARGLTVTLALHAAEELPYPAASFELVTCRVAAHHFSEPQRFLREVARVLVPGGYLALIDGTVPDQQPTAEAWLHAIEKRRDPSHQRFLSPNTWRLLCGHAGLTVTYLELHSKVQPDLEWYFSTANTTPENRQAVRVLLETAPPEVRQAFQITTAHDKITWVWPIVHLLAEKPRSTA